MSTTGTRLQGCISTYGTIESWTSHFLSRRGLAVPPVEGKSWMSIGVLIGVRNPSVTRTEEFSVANAGYKKQSRRYSNVIDCLGPCAR